MIKLYYTLVNIINIINSVRAAIFHQCGAVEQQRHANFAGNGRVKQKHLTYQTMTQQCNRTRFRPSSLADTILKALLSKVLTRLRFKLNYSLASFSCFHKFQCTGNRRHTCTLISIPPQGRNFRGQITSIIVCHYEPGETGEFLANENSSSCSLYVIGRPSVCLSDCLSVVCLSVTFVHPTQAIEIFGNISTLCGTLAIRDLCIKILQRSSQGNPSVGGVKHKRGGRI